MQRRDLSKALIASATGAALLSEGARAQTCTAPCYPRTAGEIAVGVTPTNTAYPPGNVLRYGADPTNVAYSQTAFLNAQQVATHDGIELLIPTGNYKFNTSLAWGFSQLRVKSTGIAVLTFPNANQGITIDGGLTGGGIYGVQVSGYIKVVATSGDAWFVRACHHSRLEMRVGSGTTGLRTNWCVLSTFYFTCSSNEGALSPTVPTTGIIVDTRSAGEWTSACRFVNVMVEGLSNTSFSSIGIDLQGSFENTFEGGSSEANDIGLRVANSTSNKNTLIGFDFEDNRVQDALVIGGASLTFLNCNSASACNPAVHLCPSGPAQPNIDLRGGDNTSFLGGYLRWVNVQAASTGTSFIGCQVSDASGIGIQGSGPTKILGVQKVNGALAVTGQVNDDLGSSGTFTPTIAGGTSAGSQTYATNGQEGYFTRVGRVMHFTLFINLTSNSGGSGSAIISGLPFSGRNKTNCYQSFTINDYTGVTLGAAGRTLSLRMNPGYGSGTLLETDTGSISNFIPITSIAGNAMIILSGSYLTD